jgi:hypothetical protein
MRNSKVIGSMASMVVIGGLTAIVLVLRGGFPPRLDSKPHQAVGWFMARQALSLLKPGGQITIIARDTAAFKNPAADIQLASFKKSLRKAQATIRSSLLLQTDPLRPLEVPPGDFLELIRKTPKGSVIVSFMGPPMLSAAQRNQLGEINPAIVALCPGSVTETADLRGLFEQGLLHAAVISRRSPSPSSAQAKGLQGCFDQWYEAVTVTGIKRISRATSSSCFRLQALLRDERLAQFAKSH